MQLMRYSLFIVTYPVKEYRGRIFSGVRPYADLESLVLFGYSKPGGLVLRCQRP